MKPILVKLGSAAVAATLFAVSSLSYAVMYKWTEQNGTVTYSNTPPPDPSKVRNFIVLESSGTPSEKRGAESASRSDPGIRPEASSVWPDTGMRSDPARIAVPDATRPESGRRQVESATTDSAPRVLTRPSQPEAVQDPCLRSADPQCYQRHRDKYHPYFGYAPSVTTGASPTSALSAPVGATSSAAAGGAVGGQIRITPGASGAKAVQPLPPASTWSAEVRAR